MKKLFQKLALSVSSFGMVLASAALLAVPAAAQGTTATEPNIQQGLNAGTCLSTTDTGCVDQGTAEESVNTIITTVINIFSLVVGVISVIMVIIGGLKYITSGGDSGNTAGAKNTILFAIVGLVIVALAQVIVRFVLGRVTGAT